MLVSDYTRNHRFRMFEALEPANHVFEISCFGGYSDTARDFQPGDIVRFKNVRITANQFDQIEGSTTPMNGVIGENDIQLLHSGQRYNELRRYVEEPL